MVPVPKARPRVLSRNRDTNLFLFWGLFFSAPGMAKAASRNRSPVHVHAHAYAPQSISHPQLLCGWQIPLLYPFWCSASPIASKCVESHEASICRAIKHENAIKWWIARKSSEKIMPRNFSDEIDCKSAADYLKTFH